MNRVRAAFDRAKRAGRPALVIYLTFGDPDLERSVDVVAAAADGGADVIELGIPFSDPNADGVVIQQAMHRALEAGATLDKALSAVKSLRDRGVTVPIVLFGYYNPIVARGVNIFARDAGAAGVDAVLTVDLPMDELTELHGPLHQHGVSVVPLVAPTTGSARFAEVKQFEPAFVYYVSMTGVTGGSLHKVVSGEERVAEIQAATEAPVAVGFGIRTAEDAERVGAYADGVVVGSEVIRKLADGDASGAAERVRAFVADLRGGCERARG